MQAALLLGVLALRLHYVMALPVNTGDVLRHLYHGLVLIGDGPAEAMRALLDSYPDLEWVPWARLPYNYPPMALLWDGLIAWIHPSVGAYKLGLTAVDALTALLILRLTGERWLALAYWALPPSIWWSSHEGQFEGLQNAFMVAALVAFRHRRWLGWAVLGLAIQVKAFAVFLAPWMLAEEVDAVVEGERRQWWGLFLGLLPTVALFPIWNPLRVLYGASFSYNPFHWNFFKAYEVGWEPSWLVGFNQAGTYLVLAAVLYLVLRRTPIREYLPALLFLVALKSVKMAQPWYVLVFPVLWLPLRRRRWRLALVVGVVLLNVRSFGQMVSGPFGFMIGDLYEGIRVWSALELPR